MKSHDPVVFHATSLVIGSYGILLSGVSGAGKSSLALTLIERAHLTGRVGVLVSDDQTVLSVKQQKLIACAPPSIAGAIEIRGAGLFTIPFQAEAEIHLLVELVEPEDAPRYPLDSKRELSGVMVPVLVLPIWAGRGDSQQCARAIEATLFMKRWGDREIS